MNYDKTKNSILTRVSNRQSSHIPPVSWQSSAPGPPISHLIGLRNDYIDVTKSLFHNSYCAGMSVDRPSTIHKQTIDVYGPPIFQTSLDSHANALSRKSPLTIDLNFDLS